MSTITTINAGDLISGSRTDINTNFSNLNTDKEEVSNKSTDNTLGGASPSDTKYPSQKATKDYADSLVSPTGKSWNEYAVDAVGTDAYAITLAGFTAYVAGQTFKFKAGTANTGACSLKVNGLAVIPIKKDVSSDLATGDILANQIVTVIYDGTNMQLQSQESGIAKTADLTAYQKIDTTVGTGNPPSTSSTQTITHGLGRIPKIIRIRCLQGTVIDSVGVHNLSGDNVIYMADTGGGLVPHSNNSACVYVQSGVGTNGTAIINNIGATTFDIVWTMNGTMVSAVYLWEAQ